MRANPVPLLIGALLAASAPAPALSQQAPEPQEPVRAFAGGSLSFAQPRGDFAKYVDAGFGGDAHLILRLDARGIFGLRADGAFLVYGSETRTVPLSSTIGGRILVDVTTQNNIAFFGAGPQLMVPNGRLRPYLHGFAGASYFSTGSSVEGVHSDEPFAHTLHQDDLTFSWGGGSGLYIPVRGGAQPISIDLGVRYHDNGRARYLREGSIRDNADGTISFTPIESDTDLLAFRLGVSVGLRGEPERR